MLDDKTARQRRPADALRAFLATLQEGPRIVDRDAADALDRRVRAAIAELTQGMSPLAVVNAYVDWLGHLALSPGKIARLLEKLAGQCAALGLHAVLDAWRDEAPSVTPVRARRLQGPGWSRFPFNVLAQGHEMAREFVAELTRDVAGVRPDHRDLVAFLSRQIVELLSPANFPVTNPEVIETTRRERGANLRRGVGHLVDDLTHLGEDRPPADAANYAVGTHVGVTPGKVVYRNELIELIQYESATPTVGAEPVLIVPAWIMKYYILDLSPANSLVRYLVERGKTVFIVSWKNPDERDRDLGMDDYLQRGLLRALDAVTTITGADKVHGVGYCLGGTLLTIAAALMAREGDGRLATFSSFASQIDFKEPGEITLFLGESAFAFLEPMMARKGYLPIHSMVGAFKSLRAPQQFHAPAVERYLLGREQTLTDLTAWNVDGTRLPYRMHREYLRRCYLDNDLAEARFKVGGRPVCVGDIEVPAFLLGTVTDHVAPWRSVYKGVRLLGGDVTFALTTAGHNAGIVSGPEHPRRRYQIASHRAGERYVDPDTWHARTETHAGSWWPAWNDWLDAHTASQRRPPPMGAPDDGYAVLDDAPGRYVFG